MRVCSQLVMVVVVIALNRGFLMMRFMRSTSGQIGELDAVVGQPSVDAIRNCGDQRVQKSCSGTHVCTLDQFSEGELGSTVDGYEEIEFAWQRCAPLPGRHGNSRSGSVQNFFLLGLVPSTSGRRLMPCRSRQRCRKERVSLEGGLKCIEAIVPAARGCACGRPQ